MIFIKASFHQFYFGDINNEPPNYDTSGKDNFTGDYGNDAMILVNLSDRDNISTADIIKLLCSYNPYSTQQLKKITIDVKLHQQVNTQFIYVSNNNFIDWSGFEWVSYGEDYTDINTSSHLCVSI